MSVLPVGRSLRQFFPDIDEFMADPAAYLQDGVVEIGPRRAYGLAALFGAFGAAFLVACVVSGVWNDERLLLGIGLLIGATVWLGWSMRLRGHSLLLRPDGLEVRYRDTVVWCPWALFNADGTVVVPDADDPRIAVIVPIAPEAVPFVELRRNESTVANGAMIKAPQFRLIAPDQLILTARYELAAADLGQLLLKLGGRLGRRLPRELPPPEAYPAAELPQTEIVGPDGDGWYTVPLGKLRFPPTCSSCGEPTSMAVSLEFGNADIANRLTGTARTSALTVPLCTDCQQTMRYAYQRGGIRGLNIGAVIGTIASAGLALLQGEREPVSLAFAGLAGAAIGALLGFLAGSGLTRPGPIETRRYRPDLGTLQVRFRNAHYADQVVAATSRARSRSES
jgi:hypothetical protein